MCPFLWATVDTHTLYTVYMEVKIIIVKTHFAPFWKSSSENNLL